MAKCSFCDGKGYIPKRKSPMRCGGFSNTFLTQDITLGSTVPCPLCERIAYLKHYKDQGINANRLGERASLDRNGD